MSRGDIKSLRRAVHHLHDQGAWLRIEPMTWRALEAALPGWRRPRFAEPDGTAPYLFTILDGRGAPAAEKAYADQLKAGESYTKLTDVIAISICDFVLWPDAEQDAANLPRVPMMSRWNMTERGSGNHGLLQVQYAFLELPKLPARPPETGAELWAWLFVHAPELTEVPPDAPPGARRSSIDGGQAVINWYATLSQEIEIAGQRGARERAADAEREAQEKAVARTDREVAAAAWRAYFEAIAGRDEVSLGLPP
jgi:hypothetical protein